MFDLPNIASPTIEWAQLGNGPAHQGVYLGGGSLRGPGSGPTQTALTCGVPNPFNPFTRLGFAVDQRGEARVGVYDAAGRYVRSLFLGEVAPGSYEVTWDGRDSRGARVGPAYTLCDLRRAGP